LSPTGLLIAILALLALRGKVLAVLKVPVIAASGKCGSVRSMKPTQLMPF
jgi:hypothetical protein